MTDETKLHKLIRDNGPLYLPDIYRLMNQMPVRLGDFLVGVDQIRLIMSLRNQGVIRSTYSANNKFQWEAVCNE